MIDPPVLTQDQYKVLRSGYDSIVNILKNCTAAVKGSDAEEYWYGQVLGKSFADEFGYVGDYGGDQFKKMLMASEESFEVPSDEIMVDPRELIALRGLAPMAGQGDKVESAIKTVVEAMEDES